MNDIQAAPIQNSEALLCTCIHYRSRQVTKNAIKWKPRCMLSYSRSIGVGWLRQPYSAQRIRLRFFMSAAAAIFAFKANALFDKPCYSGLTLAMLATQALCRCL